MFTAYTWVTVSVDPLQVCLLGGGRCIVDALKSDLFILWICLSLQPTSMPFLPKYLTDGSLVFPQSYRTQVNTTKDQMSATKNPQNKTRMKAQTLVFSAH